MKPDERIHEGFETINAIQEIQEIDKVICQHYQSPYFDRLHAQVIIKKYLDTDPYLMIANAVLPNHVPLEQATNKLLWTWLNAIKGYLSFRRVKEIAEKIE